MRVLVTGANGFVGRALSRELLRRGRRVRAAVRSGAGPPDGCPDGCEARIVGDLGPDTDWSAALEGVDAVAHLAARVHVMRERAADPLAAFRRTNVEGTLRLARSAAAAGVKKFVFLSSVKALGEATPAGPFTDSSPADPRDPYGVSKREAETGLSELAAGSGMAGSGMKVAILRPPLVYGPGVKGNFLSLLRLIERGVPLPLAGLRNRRSLLYLGNLVDAIDLCLSHDGAAGRTFLIRDGEDLSSAELVRRLAAALGRRAPLFSLPEGVLRLAASCIGRRAAAQRLLGSLTVDDGRLRRDLGWSPPFAVEEALAETAAWFQAGAES